MLRVGQQEIDEIAQVLLSGKVFRYGIGSQCNRFEERYAKYLDVKHVVMTASGTNSITAALVGLRIGPGDEVIVPACTYMASAISVLAVGAIPVVVDIDASITLDPKALEAAVGPRTKAVIPVHMWGMSCAMKKIMRVAKKHNLFVVEDACQAVGGGYEGRMLGSIGHVGTFSFNYYKNMTAGEGGCVVTNEERFFHRIRCAVDCCGFYWEGRDEWVEHFAFNGARASELEGAMLNAQLDRLPALIRTLQKQKKKVLDATADTGLKPVKANSLDWECGTNVMYTLPTIEQAEQFAQLAGGGVAGKTGRHIYTEWDPLFQHKGAPHEALNPYNLKENADCRMDYSKDMCAKSLDLLNRTVMLGNSVDRKAADVNRKIKQIREAAKAVL